MNDSTSKPNDRPILGVKKPAVTDKVAQTPVPAKKVVLLKSSHIATNAEATKGRTAKAKADAGEQSLSRPSPRITWQELEAIVRAGAEAKFGARARAETAARDTFANVDAVLRQCLNF